MLDYTQFYCRGAREEEITKLVEVTQSAFGEARTRFFAQSIRFHLSSFEDDRVIVKKSDNSEEIVGCCPIVQYPFHMGPVNIKAGGIWMFGIAQAYKKKGLGQILLEDCNNYLTRLGYDVNLLFTGSPAFYRHKGYELCNLKPKYSCAFDKLLQKINSTNNTEFNMVSLTSDLLPQITQIYEKFNQSFPLSRIRPLEYWKRYFDANRNGMSSSVFLIEKNHTFIGYVWCQKHENQLIIPEYALDPSLPIEEQNKIEDWILRTLISKYEPLGANTLSFTLFPSFPLVQRVIQYGAQDMTAIISSLMVAILNLNQFLLKYVEFLRQVRIPKISEQWVKLQGDFNIGLQIEDQILQFKSEKNQITVTVNPLQKPVKIVSIIRRFFGIMVFGNFTPQELIECDYWACPPEILKIFECFFPHLEGLVYTLDGF